MEKYFVGDMVTLLTHQNGYFPDESFYIKHIDDYYQNKQKTMYVYSFDGIYHAFRPFMIRLKHRPLKNWIKYYLWKIKNYTNGE